MAEWFEAESARYAKEEAITEAWSTIVETLGYKADDPHLRDTPARVARFMLDWHTIEAEPPKLTTFPNGQGEPRIGGLVVTGRIKFASLCAHHGLPFAGEAVIGYIPGDKVLGLSKFARVLDYYAHRFQVQERLTELVANHLEKELEPRGVGVVTRAHHFCMSLRGACKTEHETVYSALRGLIFDDARSRSEFLSLANGVHT